MHRQLITWRTKASEASAALSELETKLKMATKPSKEDETIMIKHENDTFFNITTKTEDIVPVVLQDITESFITDFRPINASAIKDLNDSRRKASKESVVKPGILVTGSSNENKTVKKTSFK